MQKQPPVPYLWRKFWGLSWWWKGPVLGVTAFLVLGGIGAAVGGGGGDDDKTTISEVSRTASATAARTVTAAATRTATRAPSTIAPVTPPPTVPPTSAPPPPPPPIDLSGVGQTATESVTPGCPICRVTLTHNGSSNFIVETFKGSKKDVMVNEIGL